MRSVSEWIGTTDDSPIPDRVKIRVFARCNGRCRDCTRKCGVGGEPSSFDHIVALINGGKHAESNLQLLCATCHAIKTKADLAEKSRVYKRRKSNAGIRKPSKFACSKNSKFKKKISGEIVLRS
jgi:5-methylcytosine-specific restriction endonuclease McrA